MIHAAFVAVKEKIKIFGFGPFSPASVHALVRIWPNIKVKVNKMEWNAI